MGNIVNNIISFVTKSTADALFDETKISDSLKMEKIIKVMKNALKTIYKAAQAEHDARSLYMILSDYYREKAIRLLDSKLTKHKNFINMTTPITNRHVVFMQNPYGNKTDENIKIDIRFTIFIIYFKAVTNEILGKALTEVFKKIIRIIKNEITEESEDNICKQIQKNLGLKP
jgi:hypothetical protein